MATPAQAKALETKALAAASKSEGMRMLFEAGYSVQDVRTLFGVAYGFAYGVYQRMEISGGVADRGTTAKALPAAKTTPKTKVATKAPATAPKAAKVAASVKQAAPVARVATRTRR